MPLAVVGFALAGELVIQSAILILAIVCLLAAGGDVNLPPGLVNAGVDDIGPDRRHIIIAVSRDARRQSPGALEYFTAPTLGPIGITFPVLPFGTALHFEVLLDRVFHQTGQHFHQRRTFLEFVDQLAQRALKVSNVKNDVISHQTNPPVTVTPPATAGRPASGTCRRPATAGHIPARYPPAWPAPGGVHPRCG